MELAELQLVLAANLTGRTAAPPAGCGAEAVERARRALVAKRRRAARHLLPRTAAALGRDWAARFRQHAGSYAPSAMLYHVDDAWELAARLAAARLPAGAGRQDAAAAAAAADLAGAPAGADGEERDGWQHREAVPRLRAAARADLLELRLRYARGRRPGAGRIRERRAPLLAWTAAPHPALVLRLPGREGLVWRWAWPPAGVLRGRQDRQGPRPG